MYKGKRMKKLLISSFPALLIALFWIGATFFLFPLLLRYDGTHVEELEECIPHRNTALNELMETNLSTNSSSSLEEPVLPKFGVTICTIVRNQASRLVEWIEFHRMQGVNHFVIYDDSSIDGLGLVLQLYEQMGETDLIEIFPSAVADSIFYQSSIGEYRDVFRRRQLMCYTHCSTHVNTSTEWFLVIDVDEYVFGVKKPLVEELRDPKWRGAASIILHNIVFGTSGVEKALQVFLQLDPYTGKVALQYASAEGFYELPLSQKNTSDPFPLLIEANPGRMPYNEIDGPIVAASPEICATGKGMWRIECRQKYGKYLIRPNVCITLANHWCQEFKSPYEERYVSSSMSEIRLHHYYIRSKEEFLTMKGWSTNKMKTFAAHDKSFLSSTQDTTLVDRFASSLRERINLLSPQKVDPIEAMVGWKQ